MKKYLALTIIGIICTVIFSIIHINNDYMTFKLRKCKVIDKLKTDVVHNGTHKSSGKFYLVLKEERGILFDIPVSPATYSQSKIGGVKTFNLRQMDIKQTIFENSIYFMCYVVFGTIGFICIAFRMVLEILYLFKIKIV